MARRWPWQKRAPEVRQITWPFDVGPPGNVVSVSGVDDALRLIPVYAAARLLADSVAALPLQQYRLTGGGSAVKMPASDLFRDPSMRGTLYDWLFSAMTSLVLKGNAFGLVTRRDDMQYPLGVEWLDPDKVWIDDRESPYGRYFHNGHELNPEDVVHIRAFTLPGRLRGVSPLAMFAQTIGAGMAMTAYSADWFANGGFPPGTFKNTQVEVSQAEAEIVKRRLMVAMAQHAPLVYGSDWDYNAITVPPEEAQFVQATQMNATQIAAIYGIPPERIGGSRAGGSLTYANQEQDEIAYQTSTVRPWAIRLERVFFDLLPPGQYVRFNLDAAIRSDLKTRHEVYQIDRNIGLRSVDELRALDELPPLPNGEGAEYTPLQKMAAQPAITDGQPATDPAPPLARPRAVS